MTLQEILQHPIQEMTVDLAVDAPKPNTEQRAHIVTCVKTQPGETFEAYEKRAIEALRSLILNAHMNTRPADEPKGT